MPNDISKTKKATLDNLCLTLTNTHVTKLYATEYIKAMETIRISELEKNKRFTDYIQRLENNGTKANHTRTLLNFQRVNAPNKTMRECNTIPIACIRKDVDPREQPITLKINEYGYGLSGLNRCKNPFCVLCSRSRAGERAHKIKKGIEGATKQDKSVWFVTLTIPRQGDIKTARQEINKRWKGITELFASLKRSMGVSVHYARALDVTFKKYVKSQRYHLHIHAVVVSSIPDLDTLMIDKWLSYNTQKIKARSVSQKIDKVSHDNNSESKVSKYVAKMAGLALEIANGTQKDSKGKTSSSLMDLMIENTALTQGIYKEYLKGMKRARTLVFSRNWKELIEPEDDEPLENFEIDIPLDKWQIIKPVWIELAEKIQFELFIQSVNSQGEPDVYRQGQIIKDVGWWIENATDTQFLQLYLYQSL